jgi:methylphosphotriester-DNA--protein-cysteine methyltransferase
MCIAMHAGSASVGAEPSRRRGTPLMNPEYSGRVNRVINHIRTHLETELSLETLAGVASFSPYHFHRIFK